MISLTRIWQGFVVLAGLTFAAPAIGGLNPTLTALSNGVDDGNRNKDTGSLTISAMRIDIHVHGHVADVVVEAKIANGSDGSDEGRFSLIMPDDAVVTGYALDVDGRMISGQLIEQPKARNVYEDEVRKGIDPGLAEVTSQNLFQTRIFPITRDKPRTIRVSFSAPFDPAGRLFFPLETASAVNEFAVSLTIDGYKTPPKVLIGQKAYTLDRKGMLWIAQVTHKNHELKSALSVAGGELSGSVLVSRHKNSREFFQIIDGTKNRTITRQQPERIRVYWDRSLSRRDDLIDKEADLLAAYIDAVQAFNTTTSMGRLTLNVLLSFAQFEREVTGERIRDKIAASKARGMWMGGVVPLGYEVKDRKLIVVPAEAERVRHIYQRYLELGSVLALETELAAQGLRSRVRIGRTGKEHGGKPFSRGALYLMLRNRIYLGEITHKGKAYPGEHQAIVDEALFSQVAALLEENSVDHANAVHAEQPSLLCGLVRDAEGRRMKPEHSTKRGGIRYRYYVSRREGGASKVKPVRVPAGDLESLVVAALRHEGHGLVRPNRSMVANIVTEVVIHRERVEVHLSGSSTANPVVIDASLIRRGKETRLVEAASELVAPRRDPSLIKLIVNASRVRAEIFSGRHSSIREAAHALGYRLDYCAVLLRLAFLAPDIVVAILDGRQPPQLNRQRLARVTNLPIDWQAQRELLGYV